MRSTRGVVGVDGRVNNLTDWGTGVGLNVASNHAEQGAANRSLTKALSEEEGEKDGRHASHLSIGVVESQLVVLLLKIRLGLVLVLEEALKLFKGDGTSVVLVSLGEHLVDLEVSR